MVIMNIQNGKKTCCNENDVHFDLRCDQKRTLSSYNLDIRIHHDIQLPQDSCCYVFEENTIPTLFHTCKKINNTHINDEKNWHIFC